jgi:hypothetical protein
MPKLDDQISTLQQKLQQLKLRQQRIEARQLAISALRERKAETRRKILMGGLILEKLRHGQLDRQLVHGWLDQTLTRAADRALFELPAIVPVAEAVASAVDGSAASAQRTPAELQPPPRLVGDDGHGVR